MIFNTDRSHRPEGGIHFQFRQFEQSLGGLRQFPEAIDQFLSHVGDCLYILEAADAAIDIDFLPHIDHVITWQVGFDRQMNFDIEAEFGRLVGQLSNGIFEQLAVQLVSDRGDVSALLGAEQVSCSADFEISHRDAEPGSELREFLDGMESSRGIRVEVFVSVDQQIAMGLMSISSDPSSQLMQFR